MLDNLELVARPEGAQDAGMPNDLVCLTDAETRDQPHRPAAQLANPGFVYFIRAGRTNNVKIGWALDVDKRLAALQTGSPPE